MLVQKISWKIELFPCYCPDISFAVGVVSKFLNSPCEDHWNTAIRILKYIKGSPEKSLLYAILKSFVIKMLNGQDLHLIGDQLPVIVSPLVIT